MKPTVEYDVELRMAEGFCPHPDHGRMQPRGEWGRCGECGGLWRLDMRDLCDLNGQPDGKWAAYVVGRAEHAGRYCELRLDPINFARTTLGAGFVCEETMERLRRAFG